MKKPTIPEVVEKFAAYYEKPEGGAWGALHIVLDDGNVQNDHVQFCLDVAIETNDLDAKELAEILLQMSKTQRLKLKSKVYEFINKKNLVQESVRRGLEQSARGETHDMGSFAQHLDKDE